MNEHAADILKVGGLNLAACWVSYASAEQFFRIAAPAAAFAYSMLKIGEWLFQWWTRSRRAK